LLQFEEIDGELLPPTSIAEQSRCSHPPARCCRRRRHESEAPVEDAAAASGSGARLALQAWPGVSRSSSRRSEAPRHERLHVQVRARPAVDPRRRAAVPPLPHHLRAGPRALPLPAGAGGRRGGAAEIQLHPNDDASDAQDARVGRQDIPPAQGQRIPIPGEVVSPAARASHSACLFADSMSDLSRAICLSVLPARRPLAAVRTASVCAWTGWGRPARRIVRTR
jgi:hypothetical protein